MTSFSAACRRSRSISNSTERTVERQEIADKAVDTETREDAVFRRGVTTFSNSPTSPPGANISLPLEASVLRGVLSCRERGLLPVIGQLLSSKDWAVARTAAPSSASIRFRQNFSLCTAFLGSAPT